MPLYVIRRDIIGVGKDKKKTVGSNLAVCFSNGNGKKKKRVLLAQISGTTQLAAPGSPVTDLTHLCWLPSSYEHLRKKILMWKTFQMLTSTHIPLTTSTVLAFVTETYINHRWFGQRPHTCGFHTCGHRHTNTDIQQEEEALFSVWNSIISAAAKWCAHTHSILHNHTHTHTHLLQYQSASRMYF